MSPGLRRIRVLPDITKTHEPRDILLTQNLKSMLELREYAPDGSTHEPDRYVFGNEFGEPVKYWRVNQAWHDTCAAADITGLHFHDLRRDLASTLRESGAPDHIVADWLGHANISTTSRYLKASRAGLKQYPAALRSPSTRDRQTARTGRGAIAREEGPSRFAHGSHTARSSGVSSDAGKSI